MDVELSKAETDRYARQLSLAEFGPRSQERLKQARVLVVGAGPIGATAAGQLASVGVGYIGIVDHAKVEALDLTSQTVHLMPDIGAGKADNVCAKLGLLNPDVQLDAYPVELTEDNVDAIVVGHDLVLSCVSANSTRLAINDSCVGADLPLIDCLTRGSSAAVQVVRPTENACLRCAGAEAVAEVGVAPGLAGVAGSLVALEAIKLLAGFGQVPAGRIEIGAVPGSFSVTELERQSDCPACGGVVQATGAAS
jgi:molybdopterin/thiamine biosynthesis adenylyltransferase